MCTPYSIEDMAEELCEYCECTEFGLEEVNLCPEDLCNEAYKNYLESFED